MRRLASSALLAIALASGLEAGVAGAAPLADIERLAWMAGSWRHAAEGVESEEHWLPPKGGLMLGLHRTVGPGRSAFFEYLRIETGRDGLLAYVASPSGSPGTSFRLIEIGERRAVFAAERRDFPQRITYWMEGDGALRARVEGKDSGRDRVEEWRWQRLTP